NGHLAKRRTAPAAQVAFGDQLSSTVSTAPIDGPVPFTLSHHHPLLDRERTDASPRRASDPAIQWRRLADRAPRRAPGARAAALFRSPPPRRRSIACAPRRRA